MKIIKIFICFLILINPIITVCQESDLALDQLQENSSSSKLTFEKINSKYELTLDTFNSTFIIKGTSSLHDWEMISNIFNGTIIINKTNDENLDIKGININVGVKTLISGNKIMDKKCYKALRSEEHPNINYQFKNIKEIKLKTDNTFSAVLNGTLTIAGKTNLIEIVVEIVLKDDKISIKGEKAFKMSDFDVKPPKALLGTIKTGNDITIEFNLNYIKS